MLKYLSEKSLLIHYISNTIFTGKLPVENSLVSISDNPYILFETNMYFNSRNPREHLQKMQGERIFKKYTINMPYAVTNTDYVKKSLIKYGFRGHIETIYHPVSNIFRKLDVNKTELRRQLGLPLDKILLLSISTAYLRKNLVIIEKLQKLLNNDYRVVRVGNKIGNSINFKNITDEDLNKLYNACDVLLMPSLEEGEGIPVLEAFRTGLPVVAPNIESFREIGKDAVIFIDPHDDNSLFDGITDAINNREGLINKGYEYVREFSMDIFMEKMENLYNRLIVK